jgi:hypothetical protein
MRRAFVKRRPSGRRREQSALSAGKGKFVPTKRTGGKPMCRGLTGWAATITLLCASSLQANWILIDDFNGTGPIGGDSWHQTTPLPNFKMGGGRLFPDGKSMALHQEYPFPDAERRIRFEAYSPSGATGSGFVSAIIGAKSPTDYYEVRLLSFIDFYQLNFYTVLGGSATLDGSFNLANDFAVLPDAIRLDTSLDLTTITVAVQPIHRVTGEDQGIPVSYSFSSVPAALAHDPEAKLIGLAAQGNVEIDNLEGFVIPEATTLLLMALAYWPLARGRRSKGTKG